MVTGLLNFILITWNVSTLNVDKMENVLCTSLENWNMFIVSELFSERWLRSRKPDMDVIQGRPFNRKLNSYKREGRCASKLIQLSDVKQHLILLSLFKQKALAETIPILFQNKISYPKFSQKQIPRKSCFQNIT